MSEVKIYLIIVWVLIVACIMVPLLLNGIAYGAFERDGSHPMLKKKKAKPK